MKLVVGLGNPGEEYKDTRHNVGFILLDKFVAEHTLTWSLDKKAQAEVARHKDTLLVKPQTYMNKSGISVSRLVNYYNIETPDLLVVHDDIDLDFKRTKLQRGVGPAGHLGVQDIVVCLLSKDFWRFRVGVGRPENPQIPIEDWVLSRFTPQELEEIQNISLPISGY